MVDLYTGNEYGIEYAKKKKLMTIWIILLAIYIIISVAILVSFAIMPYGTKKDLFITSNIIISTLFFGYSMFFFSNRYYRLRKYVKMLSYLRTGIKETYTGWFLRFNDTKEVKDGVEFYTMILLEWNERKQDYFERKVLIDREIPKFEVPVKRLLKYQTQGNILIRYTILNSTFTEEKIKQ